MKTNLGKNQVEQLKDFLKNLQYCFKEDFKRNDLIIRSMKQLAIDDFAKFFKIISK